MRYIFMILLLTHGFIHVAGFAKAYGLADVPLTAPVSKAAGIIWLQAAFLFVFAALLYLARSHWWVYFSLPGILISQALIIFYWHNAKWGTLINIIILVTAIFFYAAAAFKEETKKEVTALLNRGHIGKRKIISVNDITMLPPVVQNWLRQAGVVGKENIVNTRLAQKGFMYLKPSGRPVPYDATEYFNTSNPSFVWDAKVKVFPAVYLHGRDSYQDGKGAMQIKAMALIGIVDEKTNYKLNEGSLLRYLGEICWFPTAAISHCIEWQQTDSFSAKATMTYGATVASGIFSFHEDGRLKCFTAERFNGSGDTAVRERWMVEVSGYKSFNGLDIPTKCSVSWLKKDGWFKWLTLDVTDVAYNSQPGILN